MTDKRVLAINKIMTVMLLLNIIYSLSLQAKINLADHYIIAGQTFDFKEMPLEEQQNPQILWATNYFIPEYKDGSGDIAIRDMDGNELGPKLSLNNWCHSALEGSVRINFSDGLNKVYNYMSNSDHFPVDCSSIIPMDVSKTKFKLSNSKFGEGNSRFILVPFRSIASDQSKYPAGTVLYIPKARGNKITIGNETIIHDGYFFVADRGGAIKDNHIDVFTGILRYSKYFNWLKSNDQETFEAFVVKDAEIINQLTKLHLR